MMNIKTSDKMMQAYRKRYNWALTKAGGKLYNNPRSEKSPINKLPITILVNRYGDEALAKMVAHSEDSPAIAKLNILLQKTTDDISKLLHLDKPGSKLLETPELEIWKLFVQYAKSRNNNTPK
ncbi:RxLR effector protein [Phytophthora megakarya]|uniref:RxLR effector protein n=1 Tax=Phytophthora megakarya TaxID=4795 RepID=A0A225VD36_9STRA|nr:RxLR effector protein [Phytophthora megakarya]